MLSDYSDIRRRIPEEPLWYDENGVPRYDAFKPDMVANIYADEVVLYEIACQACQTRFAVASSRDRLDEGGALADAIREDTLHYGDPPNVGCCPAGASMNCDDLRVLEYWRRFDERFTDTDYLHWKRDPALEVSLRDWQDYD